MRHGNEDTIKEIVNRVVEQPPAFALIADDFAYKPTV